MISENNVLVMNTNATEVEVSVTPRALDVIAAEYREAVSEHKRAQQERAHAEAAVRMAHEKVTDSYKRQGQLANELAAAARGLTLEQAAEEWQKGGSWI